MSPLWTIKLRSRSTVWVTSKRLISTSGGRHKAVKNWTRPSIAEMGIPKEPWQQVHNKNQKKYNMQLVAGAGAITVSLFALNVQVNFNPTPKYLKDVKFSTKTPKEVTSLFAQQEEDAESPVKIVEKIVEAVEDGTEAVEEVVEVVKETLDVVKETIEKADKVVEEVKKIEDETKEIIQESKDIISDGTQLVEDVKKVIEEGKEIVTEVAEVVKEAVIVGSGEKEQAAEMNGSSKFQSVTSEEVEEPKVGLVANMVAQIEKPVIEEEKKFEQEAVKEETNKSSENDVEDVKKVIDEGKEIGTEVAGVVKEAVIIGSGEKEQAAEVNGSSKFQSVTAEEVEEPKVGSVADMVAQIEKPVFEEEKKIEQEAVKEETNKSSENDVTQATQVTQNEEVIKPEEEKELAKMETENKIAEEENTEDLSVKIDTEIIKPVELVDETIVQSHEPTIEEAFNTEPVAHTEEVLKKSDIKEEIKSEDTS